MGFLTLAHSLTKRHITGKMKSTRICKNTASQSGECLTFIYKYIHTPLRRKKKKAQLFSCGLCRNAELRACMLRNSSSLSTCKTHHHSDLILISSCNQTLKLQGSLGQRKKLPKATQLSSISRRKGCKLNGHEAVVSIIYLLLNLFHLPSEVSQ